MHVLVKKDSATSTPVDCGSGKAAAAAIDALKKIHGAANVVNLDNTEAGEIPDEPKPKAARKRKPARKGKK